MKTDHAGEVEALRHTHSSEINRLKAEHAGEMDAFAQKVEETLENEKAKLAWEGIHTCDRGFWNGWRQHEFLNPGAVNEKGMDLKKEVVGNQLCMVPFEPYPLRLDGFRSRDGLVSGISMAGGGATPSSFGVPFVPSTVEASKANPSADKPSAADVNVNDYLQQQGEDGPDLQPGGNA